MKAILLPGLFLLIAWARPPDEACEQIIRDVNVSRAIRLQEMIAWRRRSRAEHQSLLGVSLADLDDLHAYVTLTIHVFSTNVDHDLADAFDPADPPPSRPGTPPDGNASFSMSTYFSTLFRDETYLDTTEASYLLLRSGFEARHTDRSLLPLHQVRFFISLPRTYEAWQLFIGDPFGDEHAEEPTERPAAAIGLRRRLADPEQRFNFDTLAGFRGFLNPFVRSRFNVPINFFDWLIQPVLTVEYSARRKFKEESTLFLDRKISSREMVRLQASRSTRSTRHGMRYTTAISYFNTLKFGKGFRLYASATGETFAQRRTPYGEEGYFAYDVGAGWKDHFLREWLFYEIRPSIHFDRAYVPHYATRFWLEIFFGE